MRAHDTANLMGEAITSYWNELDDTYDDYYNLAPDEWMVPDRINVTTKKEFTSWERVLWT